MAENIKIESEQNSAEAIAYKLMLDIQSAERAYNSESGKIPLTREWILNTYAECLYATKGYRDFPKK